MHVVVSVSERDLWRIYFSCDAVYIQWIPHYRTYQIICLHRRLIDKNMPCFPQNSKIIGQQMGIIDERLYARFEFKIRFRAIFYTATHYTQQHQLFCLCKHRVVFSEATGDRRRGYSHVGINVRRGQSCLNSYDIYIDWITLHLNKCVEWFSGRVGSEWGRFMIRLCGRVNCGSPTAVMKKAT